MGGEDRQRSRQVDAHDLVKTTQTTLYSLPKNPLKVLLDKRLIQQLTKGFFGEGFAERCLRRSVDGHPQTQADSQGVCDPVNYCKENSRKTT